MIKIKNHLNYWNVNNLYSWAMPQKLSGRDFEQVKDIS